ncbi:hypothetical protein JOC77_003041 [Peribacillus deserti]|uniref:YfhE family protein n=1 Tax=Peribacillus deserti TaxID=673318 RepID=A0ABS2QKG8_9BACI|nr:hypothetical protein [Peribacillus deserti]MBM7693597.1 hypothetical protein [Peribacillus deserti]
MTITEKKPIFYERAEEKRATSQEMRSKNRGYEHLFENGSKKSDIASRLESASNFSRDTSKK